MKVLLCLSATATLSGCQAVGETGDLGYATAAMLAIAVFQVLRLTRFHKRDVHL